MVKEGLDIKSSQEEQGLLLVDELGKEVLYLVRNNSEQSVRGFRFRGQARKAGVAIGR